MTWRKPQGSVSLWERWGRWECHIPWGGGGCAGLPFKLQPARMSFVSWQLRSETQGGPAPAPHRGDTGLSGSRGGRALRLPGCAARVTAPCTAALSGSPGQFSGASPGRGSEGAVFPELPLLPPVAGGGRLPGSQAQRGLKMAISSSAPCPRPGMGSGRAVSGCPGSVCPRLPGVGGGVSGTGAGSPSTSRGGGGLSCF